jgi:hypothetical protein
VSEQEAVEKALAELPRNADGSIDEKDLIDRVAELLDFDEDTERHAKAVRAVARRRRPGSSEPDGQIALPGLEPYAYEPARLIADNEGRVIEQAQARPAYKAAEASRAENNARRARLWADRKTMEHRDYAQWTIEQLEAGRDPREITYDAFVREAGIWRDGPAAPEQGPGEE